MATPETVPRGYMYLAVSLPAESLLRRPDSSPPSPSTVTPSPNLLGTPETVSHDSVSPAKSTTRIRHSGSQNCVIIDETNLPVASLMRGVCNGNGGEDGNGSGPNPPGISSIILLCIVVMSLICRVFIFLQTNCCLNFL